MALSGFCAFSAQRKRNDSSETDLIVAVGGSEIWPHSSIFRLFELLPVNAIWMILLDFTQMFHMPALKCELFKISLNLTLEVYFYSFS